MKNDLATFQLQLASFKSSLKEQFSPFKHSLIAEFSQFKNDFLRKRLSVKHHVREYLEDNSPDTAILHFGTNNLKESENEGEIGTAIMNLEMSKMEM